VWSDKTEIAADRFIAWIGVARGKFFEWRKRYGKVNEHNGSVPRDHWLLDEEKRNIIAFHDKFPLEGYRRLTFMMIDQEVAAGPENPRVVGSMEAMGTTSTEALAGPAAGQAMTTAGKRFYSSSSSTPNRTEVRSSVDSNGSARTTSPRPAVTTTR
jgi:hypothetical protein